MSMVFTNNGTWADTATDPGAAANTATNFNLAQKWAARNQKAITDRDASVQTLPPDQQANAMLGNFWLDRGNTMSNMGMGQEMAPLEEYLAEQADLGVKVNMRQLGAGLSVDGEGNPINPSVDASGNPITPPVKGLKGAGPAPVPPTPAPLGGKSQTQTASQFAAANPPAVGGFGNAGPSPFLKSAGVVGGAFGAGVGDGTGGADPSLNPAVAGLQAADPSDPTLPPVPKPAPKPPQGVTGGVSMQR